MQCIAINANPLIGDITGIERYLYEILKRLDSTIDEKKMTCYVLCPQNIDVHLPDIKRMEVIKLPQKNNKIKISAIRKFLKEKKAIYCSLSGNFCIQRGALICTHDIRPWIYPQYDPLKFRFRCAVNFISSKLFAGEIITDSDNSANEISRYLHVKRNRISVIGIGWEHIKEVEVEKNIWNKLCGIKPKQYYYSLSSRAPHKNFKWIEEVAKRNTDQCFVIGGKKWTSTDRENELPNVIYVGYVSDGENRELMENCKAFLHPSKYEGFGITPLEALACGAKICISNTSCLPEIFEDCAVYFEPDDYEVDLMKLLNQVTVDPQKILKKYSWENSGNQWWNLLVKYTEK